MSSAARANLWKTLPFVAVGGAGVALAAYYMRSRGASDTVKVIEKKETPAAAAEPAAETEVQVKEETPNPVVQQPVVQVEDCEPADDCEGEDDTQSSSSSCDGEVAESRLVAELKAAPAVPTNTPVSGIIEEQQPKDLLSKANEANTEDQEEENEETSQSTENDDVNSSAKIEEDEEEVEKPVQKTEKKPSEIEHLIKNQAPSFDWVQSARASEQENEHVFASGDHVGFEDNGSDSPVGSEVSADSGRASGGMACSLSPGVGDAEGDMLPMYEFEIPNTLVGLIIGIRGKTIKELCTRAEVKMIIRPHHNPEKADSHQICTVEGKRDCINKCLRLLRRRFPSNRFPDLNLKPVMPPPMPCPAAEIFGNQPTNLALPDGVRCEVVISSMLNPGHFFVQQPTHPTFSQLQRLDRYMLGIYSQTSGIPELPQPCAVGLLCVAPSQSGWFRAVTMAYYEEQDEVLIRYVDYGGYARLPRSDLRQIRTDLMTLPFQATECYLANVQPADGTSQWSELANEEFSTLFMSKIVEANVIGYNIDDQIPVVELFTLNNDTKSVKLDKYLLDKDLAKLADPSKVVPVSPK